MPLAAPPYGVKGVDVASAATLSLGAGNFFHVTGTVTVTAIAARPAGDLVQLDFEGALTLTHNATSLILIGAANRVTAANDTAILVSEGSGNWRELSRGGAAYPTGFAAPALTLQTTNTAGEAPTTISSNSKIAAFDVTAPVTQADGDVAATGTAAVAARRDHKHGITATSDASITTTDNTTNDVTSSKHGFAPKSPADAVMFLNGATTPGYTYPFVKGVDIASAAALTLVSGNYFHVTGTTTITSISSKAAGFLLLLEFDAVLTLTHNATTLILEDAANHVTQAGDVLFFVSEGSGNWREITTRTVLAGGAQGPAGDGQNTPRLTVDARGRVTSFSLMTTAPPDSAITFTDITTNNVSTSKHGFAPKAPNDTTKFLRGDATWAAVGIASIQKGTIDVVCNSVGAVQSATATITSVNTAKAYVVFEGSTVPSTNTGMARVELTNSTTVTAYANLSGATFTVTVGYTVVEFN